METPSLAELCQGFQKTYTPALTDIMDFEFNLHDQWLGPELRPLVPEMRVAGPAFTLRWVNDRTPGGERLGQITASIIDSLQPHHVVIIDTSKNRYAGYWGELMCNIARERGVEGAVIDGGVRDPYYIWKFGFNLFAAYACPNEADTRSRLVSFQEPIAINNVSIRPGDFVVGDFGGVVVIPQEIVVEVYNKAQTLVSKESQFRKMIREGIGGAEAVRAFGPSIRLCPPPADLHCAMPTIDIDPEQPQGVVNREQLLAELRAMGLQSGDAVLAHGSLSSFGHVEGGAQTVIDALLGVLGPLGTLVMPYFFQLYEGPYDYAHPPITYTGALPRQLLAQPGAQLSVHPSHPVVALGPAAPQIIADHYRVSAVGRGSPIDRLAKLGGRVLLLGVNQSANTTIHTGEAYAAVPYWGQARPDRPIGRWTILPSSEKIWVPLPETPGDSAGFVRIEPLLVGRNLITGRTIGRARCRLMPGQRLIKAVVDYLGRDPSGLMCQQPGCAYCAWARQYLVPQS